MESKAKDVVSTSTLVYTQMLTFHAVLFLLFALLRSHSSPLYFSHTSHTRTDPRPIFNLIEEDDLIDIDMQVLRGSILVYVMDLLLWTSIEKSGAVCFSLLLFLYLTSVHDYTVLTLTCYLIVFQVAACGIYVHVVKVYQSLTGQKLSLNRCVEVLILHWSIICMLLL